jgi:hypothetical protein
VVAGLVLAMRFVDLFWLLVPDFHRPGLPLHWMDPLAAVGLGGVWVATFLSQLRDAPLLPLQDPALEEALADARS